MSSACLPFAERGLPLLVHFVIVAQSVVLNGAQGIPHSTASGSDSCPCSDEDVPMKVAVHPPKFMAEGLLSEHYKRVYDALTVHPARTESVEQADCIFFGIDVACERSWPYAGEESGNYVYGNGTYCRDSRETRLRDYLEELDGGRGLVGGQPHVIFDMSGNVFGVPLQFRRHRAVILASPGHDATTYRDGIDVVFPTPSRLMYPGTHLEVNGSVCDPSQWLRLATFRGAETSTLRSNLASLHNGDDIVIELTAAEEPMYALADDPMQDTIQSSHLGLLLQTRFALIPYGGAVGWSSVSRGIVEAACVGAVPVILADDAVPPFSEAGGALYEAFSVRVPEAQWQDLRSILSAYSDEDVCAMRSAALDVCSAHFATFEVQVNTLLRIVARRTPGRVVPGDNAGGVYNASGQLSPWTDAVDAALTHRPPSWSIGPFVTYDCGERIRVDIDSERQTCTRCLQGRHRGLPQCQDTKITVPAGTSEASVRSMYNVGGLCVQYGGGSGEGCECVQESRLASTDFTVWLLSPSCEARRFERFFQCGPYSTAELQMFDGGAFPPCMSLVVQFTPSATANDPLVCMASVGGFEVQCS